MHSNYMLASSTFVLFFNLFRELISKYFVLTFAICSVQPDGTWSDIPRCIEHEPGLQEQRTNGCPGIPGYCSNDNPGGVCEFDCLTGPDIRSVCTVDGTWDPYPTCDGDIR